MPQIIPAPAPLTSQEAADYLGIKLGYLYQLTHGKEIRYFRSKGGGKIYFRREDLDAWAFGQEVAQAA